MDNKWKNKEVILCSLLLLAIFIVWAIAVANPEPPSVPLWEDPEMYQDIWFEPYDGR